MDRPILFSAPMVLRLLDDSKTQTRRIMKPQPSAGFDGQLLDDWEWKSPYGDAADRLWVRETWRIASAAEADIEYRADNVVRRFITSPEGFWRGKSRDSLWRPSIFMPRWASRIMLEVRGVRVERLQSISHLDAMAEGMLRWIEDARPDGLAWSFSIDGPRFNTPRDAYLAGWDTINGKGTAASNPWVWVIDFKRVQGPT